MSVWCVRGCVCAEECSAALKVHRTKGEGWVIRTSDRQQREGLFCPAPCCCCSHILICPCEPLRNKRTTYSRGRRQVSRRNGRTLRCRKWRGWAEMSLCQNPSGCCRWTPGPCALSSSEPETWSNTCKRVSCAHRSRPILTFMRQRSYFGIY